MTVWIYRHTSYIQTMNLFFSIIIVSLCIHCIVGEGIRYRNPCQDIISMEEVKKVPEMSVIQRPGNISEHQCWQKVYHVLQRRGERIAVPRSTCSRDFEKRLCMIASYAYEHRLQGDEFAHIWCVNHTDKIDQQGRKCNKRLLRESFRMTPDVGTMEALGIVCLPLILAWILQGCPE